MTEDTGTVNQDDTRARRRNPARYRLVVTMVMADTLVYFMMAAVLGGVLIIKDPSAGEQIALGAMIGGLAVAGLDSMLVGFPQEFTILALASALAIAVVSLTYDRLSEVGYVDWSCIAIYEI